MSALDRILQSIRDSAQTERDKGTDFEHLMLQWLRHDPVQAQQYSEAWTYGDWAQKNGWDATDIGIDLVAQLAEEDGFAAVQCKFYAKGHRIQKADVDTFLSASSKPEFKRRLFIDTTESDWSRNAENTIRGQTIPVNRIGLDVLRKSSIDWAAFEARGEIKPRAKKKLHDRQQEAVDKVIAGFAECDRGKMIMACGTGKTFTALRIAEAYAGPGKRVLFLVPSLALIAQTVREWALDAESKFRSIPVCSDAQVGKRRRRQDSNDSTEIEVYELEFPATTQADKLVAQAKPDDAKHMTVVFSTYQSIPVITEAQQQGLPPFDLIICDEAHRTTGATIDGEEASNFVRVHDNAYVDGTKRLYMTATPRIFGEKAKAKAADTAVELCDMDDKSMYGPTFFTLTFSSAVENGMLSDYKVIVLAMDEAVVSRSVQNRLAAENELKLDDATKIIGCYKALQKHGDTWDFAGDTAPMRRAIAFCRDIRSSKLIEEEFEKVVDEYETSCLPQEDSERARLRCKVRHVDGTSNAKTRGEKLHWLGEGLKREEVKSDGVERDELEKDGVNRDECRILSNARCLGEGVDIPSLDAILFLHPRKSQIDVVQNVGRVMRKAPGKKLGYVILPIVIPAGVAPEAALNDNERYRVVWQILNALRAHDDRFDATINKLELNNDTGGQIEVIAVTDKLPLRPTEKPGVDIGGGGSDAPSDPNGAGDTGTDEQLKFIYDEFPAAILAKIVQKCGQRTYWENWAKDVGEIARRHIERIEAILARGGNEREEFDKFLAEIRDDINSTVTDTDAIEMLAQHLITKPVFDALFEDYDFADRNPVSRAMENVVTVLESQNLQKEAEELEGFYDRVKRRASGIDNAQGKQKIIVELYDKFFKTAFPKLTEKLGIVYTPVEVADFIIHSVNDLLQQEFGQTLGSKGVHIIDPFTGTGTFITRLLESGLITDDELEHKFKHEIHANEIVLLAYYIAAVNIEAVYHSRSGKGYTPFAGICLTDTFAMYEKEDLIAALMADNSERRNRQKDLDIRVIIGNPPYSTGQRSANDNAPNVEYPTLNSSIRNSYAKMLKKGNQRNLYDSYIRAIHWASDRLGTDGGIVGFVTGNGWLDKAFARGMRKCLEEECSSIYLVDLRGDIRINMQSGGAAKEGENIFGQSSMTGTVIAFLVKNPHAKQSGQVYYFDIGDNLKGDQKLELIAGYGSVSSMITSNAFTKTASDIYYDWINQRDKRFDKFISIESNEKATKEKLFENSTLGVSTNRDAWCYNGSRTVLENNIETTADTYNKALRHNMQVAESNQKEYVIDADPKKISLSATLKRNFARKKKLRISEGQYRLSMYRPFTKQWLFYSRHLNERVFKTHKVYPHEIVHNRTIAVSGTGAQSGFSCLMCDKIPNLDTIEKAKHYPLKLFEESGGTEELFTKEQDGITDYALEHFQKEYRNQTIGKEDIFYYVYGLLHSPDYRSRFASNLIKQLPRIPAVNKEEDFWSFTQAGRALGELHVNYEEVEPYPVTFAEGDLKLAQYNDAKAFFRVEKMKFARAGGGGVETRVAENHQTRPRFTTTPI